MAPLATRMSGSTPSRVSSCQTRYPAAIAASLSKPVRLSRRCEGKPIRRYSAASDASSTTLAALGPLSASQFSSNRYNSVDLRASKSIPLGGQRKAEFVVQVFNMFGTNNLLPPGGDSYVNNSLSDSFGKILTAQPRQQGEIAIRYAF
jgi:hypothetical protein